MGKTMTRNKELPTFFGEVQIKGERLQADFENNIKPTLFISIRKDSYGKVTA